MEEEIIGIGKGNPEFAGRLKDAFLDLNSCYAGKVAIYNLANVIDKDPISYGIYENEFLGIQTEGMDFCR